MNMIKHIMIKFIKNLFKKRAWKEIDRVFLRTEYDTTWSWLVYDFYLVEYEDMYSGDRKKKEIEISRNLF